MTNIRLSRRNFLAFMAALSAVSAGGVYFWAHGPDALIGKILARRLPGVQIDETSIAALSRDVQADRFRSFTRKIGLGSGAVAANIIGIDALARFKLTATQFTQLERVVITLFLFGSNYLTVKDPRVDLVTYNGLPDVCPNPFAQYD